MGIWYEDNGVGFFYIERERKGNECDMIMGYNYVWVDFDNVHYNFHTLQVDD